MNLQKIRLANSQHILQMQRGGVRVFEGTYKVGEHLRLTRDCDLNVDEGILSVPAGSVAVVKECNAMNLTLDLGSALGGKYVLPVQEVSKYFEKHSVKESLDEVVRLYHPGQTVKVSKVDKYGYLGRENHPPTDGSLHGSTGRVTDYVDQGGKYGVNPGGEGGRAQAVRVQIKDGPHKGKSFEMMHHELTPHGGTSEGTDKQYSPVRKTGYQAHSPEKKSSCPGCGTTIKGFGWRGGDKCKACATKDLDQNKSGGTSESLNEDEYHQQLIDRGFKLSGSRKGSSGPSHRYTHPSGLTVDLHGDFPRSTRVDISKHPSLKNPGPEIRQRSASMSWAGGWSSPSYYSHAGELGTHIDNQMASLKKDNDYTRRPRFKSKESIGESNPTVATPFRRVRVARYDPNIGTNRGPKSPGLGGYDVLVGQEGEVTSIYGQINGIKTYRVNLVQGGQFIFGETELVSIGESATKKPGKKLDEIALMGVGYGMV